MVARVVGRQLPVCVALFGIACAEKSAKPAPAAVVTGAVPEAQLASLRLTRDAVNRLGIQSVLLDSASVAPTRTVGGEIVVPPGRALMVTAPMAGTIYALAAGELPVGGARVTAGQPLARLVTLPPDPARTQQDVEMTQARLEQAQREADRIALLYKDRLVSTRGQFKGGAC